jgi:hypothetical protein
MTLQCPELIPVRTMVPRDRGRRPLRPLFYTKSNNWRTLRITWHSSAPVYCRADSGDHLDHRGAHTGADWGEYGLRGNAFDGGALHSRCAESARWGGVGDQHLAMIEVGVQGSCTWS